ncbi:phage baseplate assembly protein V [Kaistia dalseonensis]|uniref:Phage baseplate assembly protein V n=1 Tax=Kaistia dalseonensis TaxID=410840 RepID=A0ABU0HB07_9HYPH|nr:phage baseplate assembly protein V [Kaistia dalseonensis]MCX5496428.1 phage baseplate assembly protein V [Kaistia dalseonensis]MDQ0439048.1 phage baseplate assembly protein V [Kaistia dalseonensis]
MMRETERGAGRRGLMGFARGVVTAVSSRAKQAKLQHLDVSVLKGESHEGAEHMEPYGMTARPHAGAEAMVLYVGGNRAHPIVISVANRKYRLQGLTEGEVAIYDDLGQKVHLTRDGIVLDSPIAVTVNAPDATLNTDVVINGTLAINGDGVTHNDRNIGADHAHSGVTPGAANTGPPV